jgi:hypothetical protein
MRSLTSPTAIALAARAAAQLVVDAPALVLLAADHKQPARPDQFSPFTTAENA